MRQGLNVLREYRPLEGTLPDFPFLGKKAGSSFLRPLPCSFNQQRENITIDVFLLVNLDWVSAAY